MIYLLGHDTIMLIKEVAVYMPTIVVEWKRKDFFSSLFSNRFCASLLRMREKQSQLTCTELYKQVRTIRLAMQASSLLA